MCESVIKECPRPTGCGEVEEVGERAAVGQAGSRLAQLVEEGVGTGLQRREARHGRVLQQTAAQGDGLGRSTWLKDLRQTGRRESGED